MAMGSWLVLWFFFSLSERARAKEDCGLVPRFFSFFFPLFTLLSRPRNLEDPTAANGRRRFLLGRGQSVSSSRSLSLSLPLSPSLSFPPFSTERITARERKEPRAKGTASQRGGKNMATATKSGRKPSASHPPPPPFRFGARRDRIDWGALHGVDIERMVCVCLSLSFEERRPSVRDHRSLSLSPLCLFPFSLPPPSFSRRCLSLTQAATTDLDALEKCVSSVAYGDLDAEPRGKLSEVS